MTTAHVAATNKAGAAASKDVIQNPATIIKTAIVMKKTPTIILSKVLLRNPNPTIKNRNIRPRAANRETDGDGGVRALIPGVSRRMPWRKIQLHSRAQRNQARPKTISTRFSQYLKPASKQRMRPHLLLISNRLRYSHPRHRHLLRQE